METRPSEVAKEMRPSEVAVEMQPCRSEIHFTINIHEEKHAQTKSAGFK